MGIKKSPMCDLCNTEEDSVEHMLIECTVSKELWREVGNRIVELGVPEYNLTESKIVTGELEKSICINSILLLTKKVIYNAMKEAKRPHILTIKMKQKTSTIRKNIGFV